LQPRIADGEPRLDFERGHLDVDRRLRLFERRQIERLFGPDNDGLRRRNCRSAGRCPLIGAGRHRGGRRQHVEHVPFAGLAEHRPEQRCERRLVGRDLGVDLLAAVIGGRQRDLAGNDTRADRHRIAAELERSALAAHMDLPAEGRRTRRVGI
jgi:hypothetical protein